MVTNPQISVALKPEDLFVDHTAGKLHVCRGFALTLIEELRLMEVLPSGTFPIVAVGEEGSRSSQLTIVWPEMAHIISSHNPLSRISCTACLISRGSRSKCLEESVSEIVF